MKSPFFSIILPTYNREKFIAVAIKSVINQTYKNWELIIIDDGSTDNTKQVVSLFLADMRIKYFYQTNQERSVARNNGIKQAKGDYICFLDSDDYYLADHLDIMNQNLNVNSKKEILTVERYYKNGDKLIEANHAKLITDNHKDFMIKNVILYSPPVQCICLHKSFFETVQFKDTWLPLSECAEFIYNLIKANYYYKYINKRSVVMVNHETNSTIANIEYYQHKIKYIKFFAKKEHVVHFFIIRKQLIIRKIEILKYKRKYTQRVIKAISILLLFPEVFFKRVWFSQIVFHLLPQNKTRINNGNV